MNNEVKKSQAKRDKVRAELGTSNIAVTPHPMPPCQPRHAELKKKKEKKRRRKRKRDEPGSVHANRPHRHLLFWGRTGKRSTRPWRSPQATPVPRQIRPSQLACTSPEKMTDASDGSQWSTLHAATSHPRPTTVRYSTSAPTRTPTSVLRVPSPNRNTISLSHTHTRSRSLSLMDRSQSQCGYSGRPPAQRVGFSGTPGTPTAPWSESTSPMLFRVCAVSGWSAPSSTSSIRRHSALNGSVQIISSVVFPPPPGTWATPRDNR